MKVWQTGVIGLALVTAMTACPSGRGGDATSLFPVKSGETWAAKFATSSGNVTIGYQLDGAPQFDADGDIEVDFATTNNVEGGYGFVLMKDNIFQASFVLSSKDKVTLSCLAPNGSGLAAGAKGNGILNQNGNRTRGIDCTVQRVK